MPVGACGNPVGLETGRRRQVVTRLQVEAEGERGRVEEGNGQDRTGQDRVEMEGANQLLSNALVERASQHSCVIVVLLYHSIK